MKVPCLSVPCSAAIDALLTLSALPLISLCLSVAIGWLLLLRCVPVRGWAVASSAAVLGGLAVGHHWSAPQCAEALHLDAWPTRSTIAVFWHIGAFEERAERLEAIVGRQLELLESSGLLREAHVYVGVVGPARPPALRRLLANPHVTVAARNGTGHECVTASALWRWALGQSCPSTWWPLSAGRSPVQYVLYMHSRGLRHSAACHYSNASSGHCAEDWTRVLRRSSNPSPSPARTL